MSTAGAGRLPPDAPVVLLWDNFGPLHIDRLNAVADHFAGQREVIGIELCPQSDTYSWDTGGSGRFRKETLIPDTALDQVGTKALFQAVRKAAARIGKGTYILCHWNVPGIFLVAIWLRLRGYRVMTMGCSKLDDKPRRARTEALKGIMFKPYQGALGSGHRSVDYFRFHGIPADMVVGEYNTVSLDRIRAQAGYGPFADAHPAEGPAFGDRRFLCVARLVPKKNLAMLLDAYALYHQTSTVQGATPRPLDICGDGPLEAELRAQAQNLGIDGSVSFHGFVQTEEISHRMAHSLALLLPSLEEQFGNVVPEAQSLGLPVIVSDNAGARDRLVKTGQSGFIIEPDNPEGLAWYLGQVATDADLWNRLRSGAFDKAPLGDAARFADGVAALVDPAGHSATQRGAV